MKKVLGAIFISFLFCNNAFAKCSENPIRLLSGDLPCTWGQIVSGDTKDCAIDDNYFTYAITCEFEEYEKKNGELSFQKVNIILKQAKTKQSFKSFFNQSKEEEEKEERRKVAEYECSIVAGKSNNAFSARQIYKKCLAYKGYN